MFPHLAFVSVLFQINYLVFILGDPLVQLPIGQILGREATTFEDIHFFAFEGVPYAAPPLGPLRFKPPQPHDNWDGILSTTSLNTTCFQSSMDTDQESEDCLYINIYTPELPSDNNDPSLNVLIFIHGGGFNVGFSQDYLPDLFLRQNIIFVTFNYRLGIFGFASTQDEVIPGNNGLKDQQFALKWTHDNIRVFGGDPNKITIMGQSSGAVSVAHQIAYQNNKGCDPRKRNFSTASLNSDFETNNDSQALLEYLRTVDAKDLDRAGFDAFIIGTSAENYALLQGLIWGPVIEVKNEDAFLTRKMYGMLNAGNFLSVPILVGFNSEESLSMGEDADSLKTLMQQYDDHVEWLVPKDMHILDNPGLKTMGETIRNMYTGGNLYVDNLAASITCFSDNILNRAVLKYAELFSSFSDAYFYQFSYDGQLGPRFPHYDGAATVNHAFEMFYLLCYQMNCDISDYPDSDRLNRERLLALWSNFIKYQNPTPEPIELLQNVTWPLLDTSDGNFYYLDINENLEIKNHPKEGRYKAWEEVYQNLPYDDFDTY
ncbi:hypothetical protein Zmor_018595 [Zophobas morio]|uniref:Carboxylic ester hydrolase n=1 Tax=Zophobas morio TaxID=2755281 RepID=A0AA38I7R4_9CUCU|nr:hypothetical protein Zmor_018595 [Zophobas morio]